MMTTRLTALAGVLTAVVTLAVAQVAMPTPTQHYDHQEQLDQRGQYWVFWSNNQTHVTFETHTNTTGWVGFGLSPNGKMYPSDVVIGGVKDGRTYFMDYHTIEHVMPVVDQSQDWFLISGSESASGTVLKFVRKLDTCDDVGDLEITDDTIRIIYSYSSEDPTDYFHYHGPTQRGAKSVILLSSSLTANDIHMPSDIITHDFFHDNYHVPANNTVYACRGFQLPPLGGKHHMIKYEPVITPGNELNVHHAVIFRCSPGRDLSAYHGAVFRCENMDTVPAVLQACMTKTLVAWGVGGQAFYYPPDAGFPLGRDQDPNFFIMETHYNNPMVKADIVDSSGFRISMTATLRPHDADLLEIGMIVSPLHIIPPMESAFVTQGFCPSDLLRRGVPPEGVNVFAVFQHSHLLGRQMITRHYRNGTELEPLAADHHYDYNFQDMRYLRHERKLYPTDKLEVKCVYDSSDKRVPTYGGLSTHEEMCVSFILYYPRMPIGICLSLPIYNTVTTDYTKLNGIMSTWNWTHPDVRARFRADLDNSIYYHLSMGDTKPANANMTSTEHPTKFPYVKPKDSRCVNSGSPIVPGVILGRK